MMELKTLSYFLCIAREQNFTRAAAKLHISQPALSKQMADLEKEVGQELFIRSHKKTELTGAGQFLKKRALEIEHLVNTTERKLKETEEFIDGTVKVGMIETPFSIQICRTLLAAASAHPMLGLNFYTGNPQDLAEKVLKDELDYAITLLPASLQELDYLQLQLKVKWYCWLKKTNPSAARKEIAAEQLKTIPLYLPDLPVFKNEIAGWLSGNNRTLQTIGTYSSLQQAEAICLYSGCGCLACFPDPPAEIACLDILPDFHSNLYLICKKYRPFDRAQSYILHCLIHTFSGPRSGKKEIERDSLHSDIMEKE